MIGCGLSIPQVAVRKGAGVDPLAPGPDAPTFAFVDETTTDATPNVDIGLPSGNGDHRDAVEDDTVQVYVDDALWFQHTLTAQNIIDGTVTVTGVSNLSDGTRVGKARLTRSGAETSDFSSTDSIVIDTTAPTLTSPAGTETGETTADLSVTTNEANGTLYVVVTTSSTSPSAAQVKAGDDHTDTNAAFADGQVIASTGSKTFNATGLSANTEYWPHFMHEDALGNQSSVATGASFTTDEAAAPSSTTWNPSDKSAGHTLSNGNLTVTHGGGVAWNSTRAIASSSTDKRYSEHQITAAAAGVGTVLIGIGNASAALTNFAGQDNNAIGYAGDGSVFRNLSVITTIQTFAVNDTICVAVDTAAELIWFRTNGGNWNNSGTANPATGTGGIDYSAAGAAPFFPIVTTRSDNDSWTSNFGATAYAQTPPGGFGNWS